ncbi:MAG: recombinase RecA [Candidatus Harrisonbacteria bacterium]|nr:recombinase RecA [Candidatus Harrisonbacteria bacterium]
MKAAAKREKEQAARSDRGSSQTADQKKEKEKNSEVQKLIEDLQDRFGEGSVMRMGELRKVNIDVIPTGSFSLDLALGVGGLPKGRVIEVFGPESSGKTTLALNCIAQSQQKGGRCAFIDAEHAMDPDYAARLGVKVKDLIISQPNNGEEALSILEGLVKSEIIDVVVVDSVAALTPKAEIEGEMGQQFIGLQARMMSQALRKLTAISAKTNTLIIFINQLREKIGVMFGSPETTPGGRALKFYSSVRIDIRRMAQIKKGETIIGNRVKAKVVKNKVAPPFKNAEFDIMYGEGISYEADVLNTGLAYKVVTKSGASYSFSDTKLGVGFDNVRVSLKEQPELLKRIEKEIKEAAKRTEMGAGEASE